ncbi:MAG: hypothetical protein J6S53_07070 [Lentisphaeria bacterium]|nr:hypothetical protein [Lentisphaeria bacterium]
MKNNMKIAVLAAVFTIATVFPAMAQRNLDVSEAPSTSRVVADKILMYIPNRVMDFLDIFSIKLGTGVTSKLQVRLTHAFGFGYGIGPTGSVEWSYGRRYGTSLDNGKELFFLGDGYYDIQREFSTGTLQDYWYQSSGMQWPEDPVFARDKAYDYWALEVEVAAFVNVKFAFHPVEFADFFAGIFCYDGLSNDDYTLIIP